jgi:hypothetical protein
MSSLFSKLVNLAGNITGTLGIANGGTGATTKTAAMDALSPMTTRGDLIRQGATDAERFAAVTNNRVVRGDGTDVVLGQIDNTGFFTTGAEVAQAAPGVVKSAGQLLGTNTNDTAGSGYVGQESTVTAGSVTGFPNSTLYGDFNGPGNKVTLTAGDWFIEIQAVANLNGATMTSGYWQLGIGTVTGNNSTGLSLGTTLAESGPPTSSANSSLFIKTRVQISGSTDYYGKVSASFTGGPPQYRGIMRAWRVR